MQPVGSVLNSIVEYGQSLYPSGQNTFAAFKSTQPFQGIMVRMQNNLCLDKVMTKMLQACDHRKELSPSRTVVLLWRIHYKRKENDMMPYAVHSGRRYLAYRHIRRIGIQNESLVWLWISQCHCLGEGSLEVLESFLCLWRPGKTNAFLSQCRKWLRDAGNPLTNFL